MEATQMNDFKRAGDLRGHKPAKFGTGSAGKIAGSIAAAVILAAVGTYAVETWPKAPAKSVVADNQLPAPPSNQ